MFGFKRNMDRINFGAKKIRTVKILKRSGTKYIPCKADFIKLDVEKDKEVLQLLKDRWEKSLMGPVYDDLEEYAADLWNNYHIFALTEPQKYRRNTKLDADKILGASLFIEYPGCRDNYISILQTKPKYISHDRVSDYKHIGQEIVRSIQEKFHKKPITVDSKESAVDFYVKQGFKQNKSSKDPYQLIWDPGESSFCRFFIKLFHNFIE